jgi:C1A family cysteine protease
VIFIALILAAALCEPITKEYIDYLKRHVDWEVTEYEENIFRGWTDEEFKDLLGWVESDVEAETAEEDVGPLPSAVSWKDDPCILPVRNQGSCGSCWAFAATGVLSDRCCKEGGKWGPLAPQELVSCDKGSKGCQGGSLESPFAYFKANGLVVEADFPYKAQTGSCPSDIKSKAHHCKCERKSCAGEAGMKACLKDGPATYGFYVCNSFRAYKGGVYKCDCSNYIGGHAVEAVGYGTDEKAGCFWETKNSWGTSWGVKGYFKLACNTCRIVFGYTCKPSPA